LFDFECSPKLLDARGFAEAGLWVQQKGKSLALAAGGAILLEVKFQFSSLLRGPDERGAGVAPLCSRLSRLFANGNHVAATFEPDGAASGAFQQVLGVAVRMHVDLDTFFVVTIWAMHGFSPVL
jgi:hypothetical protein